MLLAVDIGNSNVKFGVFDGDASAGFWQIANAPGRTAADFELLLPHEVTDWPIDAVVIGSVVPQATQHLVELAITRFQLKPFLATTSADVGMAVSYDPPGSLGIDRLADAVAAVDILGAPCIAVDIGTATTFNVVAAPLLPRPASPGKASMLMLEAGGVPIFAGGAIAPGAGILAGALGPRTAQLPTVAFARPSTVLATNSTEAIQSGLFFGHAALIDGMVERLRAEIGSPDCPVVATGGGATADFVAECRTIARVEPLLTLCGLRLIWQYSRR